MLDIKHIRDDSELFRKNQEKAGKTKKEVDEVLELDEKWRAVKQEVDKLRAKRNTISEEINKAKKTKDEAKAKTLIKEAKNIPEKIKELETKAEHFLESRDMLLSSMPNLISKHTPKGKDASELLRGV